MAGAHLDSVQEGAGINDNGTGSAALLETAIQMQKVKPNNTVRFAWWGAEEEGLLGSEFYVDELSDEESNDIALYLNFDMIGSPNYMFGVYDGDNSGGTAAPGFIPAGSAQIEDVFETFYDSRGIPSQDSEFSGRSDYGPFIAVGIPAGGLFTGAEVPKTAAEAVLYGGVPGAAYDPCYHSLLRQPHAVRASRRLHRAERGVRPDRQRQHLCARRQLRRRRGGDHHVRVRLVDRQRGQRTGQVARQRQEPRRDEGPGRQVGGIRSTPRADAGPVMVRMRHHRPSSCQGRAGARAETGRQVLTSASASSSSAMSPP